MEKQKLQSYFLLIILSAVLVLSFFIFKPFIYILILALIFGIIFKPVYLKISKITGKYKSLASLLTIFLIFLFILTPLVFLGMEVFKESNLLYYHFSEVNFESIKISGPILEKLSKVFPDQVRTNIDGSRVLGFDLNIFVNQYLKQGLAWIMGNVGTVFSNMAKIFLNLFVFVFALYYFFKDSQLAKDTILKFSPFTKEDNEIIFRKIKSAVNSVVKGNLLIALIQGALVGLGFFIFGIPNPVLWGTVGVITALIPSVGTGLVIIPAIVFLFFSNQYISAVGLLIWGSVIVGLIDNILRPKLIEKGIKLNPLIILLSVLGGLVIFGPIGFLLGPLVISLLFTLIEVYFSEKERF